MSRFVEEIAITYLWLGEATGESVVPEEGKAEPATAGTGPGLLVGLHAYLIKSLLRSNYQSQS